MEKQKTSCPAHVRAWQDVFLIRINQQRLLAEKLQNFGRRDRYPVWPENRPSIRLGLSEQIQVAQSGKTRCMKFPTHIKSYRMVIVKTDSQ